MCRMDKCWTFRELVDSVGKIVVYFGQASVHNYPLSSITKEAKQYVTTCPRVRLMSSIFTPAIGGIPMHVTRELRVTRNTARRIRT